MSSEELQQEELEVLNSIYDGDPKYKQISNTCFQYKIGEDEDANSFLLEISWTPEYPDQPPKFSLDAFYNKKIIREVKQHIVNKLLQEAENQLGTAMTFTLIEWAKDHADELTEAQPDKPIEEETASTEPVNAVEVEEPTTTKEKKKPKLSKQQKRRLVAATDVRGERPRGWDWVDIVKHLSQMGPKAEHDTNS